MYGEVWLKLKTFFRLFGSKITTNLQITTPHPRCILLMISSGLFGKIFLNSSKTKR